VRSMTTVLLILAIARPVSAQDTLRVASPEPTRWAWGASLGVPSYDGRASVEATTLALTATSLGSHGLGGEFWIGTVPRGFAEGVAVLGFRGALGYPISPSRELTLVPAVGLTMFGGAGEEGGGAVAGINWGASAIIGTNGLGVRTAVTCHRFAGLKRGIWLVEIGVVHIP
jgi:hypothetical protein